MFMYKNKNQTDEEEEYYLFFHTHIAYSSARIERNEE